MTEIRAVTMPKWGLAMTEGKVAAWAVQEGEAVGPGTELVDIETSKITNALEADADGVLRRVCAAEGDTLPVGALLGVIAPASMPDADIQAFVDGFVVEVDEDAGAEDAAAEPETVTVDGRTIRYLRMGQDGPAVLLIHGFGGDLNNWMFNQPALAERHATYAIDLPGHGGSSKEVGDGSVEAMAAAVGGLMAALGLERAHLVGHSLGGAVALALALGQPDRVASLTLVCSAGLGEEIAADYVDGFIAASRRKDIKPVAQMLFADPSLVSRDMLEDILRYKRLDGVDAALRTIAGRVFADGRQAWSGRARLDELAVPVQAVWGAQDRIVPPAHGDGLPERIGVRVIDGTGHMVHMEAAQEVNRLIEAIVAG